MQLYICDMKNTINFDTVDSSAITYTQEVFYASWRSRTANIRMHKSIAKYFMGAKRKFVCAFACETT